MNAVSLENLHINVHTDTYALLLWIFLLATLRASLVK